MRPSPGNFQAHFLPSEPNLLILVSSEKITFFQSSTVQSLWLIAKSNLFLLCLAERRGFFFFTTAFKPALLRHLLTVCGERDVLVMSLSSLVTWTAFSALLELRRWIAW